jgi:hypothetical protein
MRTATQTIVAAFGALVAVAGVEHGIGELLQGSVAPSGLLIQSWPGPGPFEGLSGEPAMTVIPNLLATGVLAILSSLAFLVTAVFYSDRKNCGAVLLGLCAVMLLTGASFGPPILGAILAAVTWLRARRGQRRAHSPCRARRMLAKSWRLFFVACLVDWVAMFPGLVIASYLTGATNPYLTLILLAGMFGFLFLAIVSGFARDGLRVEPGGQSQPPPRPAG